jgi:hypothetical protein
MSMAVLRITACPKVGWSKTSNPLADRIRTTEEVELVARNAKPLANSVLRNLLLGIAALQNVLPMATSLRARVLLNPEAHAPRIHPEKGQKPDDPTKEGRIVQLAQKPGAPIAPVAIGPT